MLALRIFKPLDRRSASAELYKGDVLVAEVLAGEAGDRLLYVHDADEGISWPDLLACAQEVNTQLDRADAEMAEVQRSLNENGS